MKIATPVQRQNGHKALWITEIRGIDVITQGIDKYPCKCPTHYHGQGFTACGEPYEVKE